MLHCSSILDFLVIDDNEHNAFSHSPCLTPVWNTNSQLITRSVISGLKGLLLVVWLCVIGGLIGCDPSSGEIADEPSTIQHSSPPPALVEPEVHMLSLPSKIVNEAGILTEQVKRGDFYTFRDYPGTIKPIGSQLAQISTLVNGRVMKVYAQLGDEVQEGDILAYLYSHELGLAQSAYLKAIAELTLATKSFERAKFLWDQKAISRAKYLQRENDAITRRVQVQESRNRLMSFGMSPEHIQTLERTQMMNSHLPIQAPFSGRIIRHTIARGEVVYPGNHLFTVANLQKIWVVANIPEKDIPYVREKEEVKVQVASFPGEWFTGRIVYAGDILDASTRTMMVKAEVPNPERRLKPEMFASVRLYLKPEPQSITIPIFAIQQNQGSPFVFVQHDAHTFEPRSISLAEEDGEHVKVLSGLKEGEVVVTAGAFVLKAEAMKHGVPLPIL